MREHRMRVFNMRTEENKMLNNKNETSSRNDYNSNSIHFSRSPSAIIVSRFSLSKANIAFAHSFNDRRKCFASLSEFTCKNDTALMIMKWSVN